MEEALGPTVTVLVALGLLASLATVVLAVQVAQRRQDRWRADDAVLTALGGTRGARAVIHLASVAAEVVLASVIAVGVMLAASPVAPIGPLHDLDPAQGVHLDADRRRCSAPSRSRRSCSLVTVALVYARPAPTRARRATQPGDDGRAAAVVAGRAVARGAQPPAGGGAPRTGHDGRGGAPRRRGDRRGVEPRGRGRPAALRRGLRRARLQLVRRPDRRRASSRSSVARRSTVSASYTSYPMLVGRADRPRPQRHADPWGERPDDARGGARAPRRRGGARGRHRRSPRGRPRRRRCRCSPATRYSGRSTAPAAVAARRRARDVRRHLAAGSGRGAARRRRARHPTHVRAAARLRREPARVDHGAAWRTAPNPTELIDANPDGVEDALGHHDAVVHRCATRRAPAARRGVTRARRRHRGRAPAPRRRARPGCLVAHPSERRRALGAPGPRMLPLPARPHRGVADRCRPASPPSPSACRSGSPSVDSPSAASPARSRSWTTRAHRRGSSWRWRWPSSRRSGSARWWPARSRATSPAPPPSATPKAAAPDASDRVTCGHTRGSAERSHVTRSRRSGRPGLGGQCGRVEAVDELRPSSRARRARPGRGWPPGGCGPRPASTPSAREVGEGDRRRGAWRGAGRRDRAPAGTCAQVGRGRPSRSSRCAWLGVASSRSSARTTSSTPWSSSSTTTATWYAGTPSLRRSTMSSAGRVTAPRSRSTIVTGSPSPRRRSAAGRPSASALGDLARR